MPDVLTFIPCFIFYVLKVFSFDILHLITTLLHLNISFICMLNDIYVVILYIIMVYNLLPTFSYFIKCTYNLCFILKVAGCIYVPILYVLLYINFKQNGSGKSHLYFCHFVTFFCFGRLKTLILCVISFVCYCCYSLLLM